MTIEFAHPPVPRRALVAGGAGFLGSHLCDALLAQGCEVICLDSFITGLPKAELHLHIEGSLEPELMFELAKRNGIDIPYASVEDVRAAYAFSNLQDFLDIYYAGANVLRTRQDFHDLAAAYFDRIAADGVVHAEIMFDPQTHTDRGIPFDDVIEGLLSGMAEAEAKHGITSKLILSFLRRHQELSPDGCAAESLRRLAWPGAPGLACRREHSDLWA